MGIPDEIWAQWGLVQPQRITEGITGRDISKVLNEASKEAEKLIKFNLDRGNFSGATRAAQLQTAIAGMAELQKELWGEVEKLTKAGMYQAAQLAADQALDMDLMIGMPGFAVLQYSDYVHWNASQAVNDLISRHTNGFALSERIYANGASGVRKVGGIVDRGLTMGLSAKELAQQVRGYYNPGVPGGASYAAMRLARTEINNAHHQTSINMSNDKPWVLGFKWNLSSSHPRPDPCDDLAAHDEGLGEGVFEKKNVPSKPHPQCLCYLTHIQEDEDDFIDNLVNGKYDEPLAGRGVRC